MPRDELEKIEDATLARMQHADGQICQAVFQSGCCARRVCVPSEEGQPGEHIGFGIVPLAAVPKGGFDQAAWINPVTIARGNWSGISR
jgi:hypothetical protein